MAKPELGTKRLCAGCGAKFYDLNKDPIHCPKCGVVYEVAVAARPARPEPVAASAMRIDHGFGTSRIGPTEIFDVYATRRNAILRPSGLHAGELSRSTLGSR